MCFCHRVITIQIGQKEDAPDFQSGHKISQTPDLIQNAMMNALSNNVEDEKEIMLN